ncbi:MAG: hypothetical protein FWD50_07535 [Betaproteobacteria bacterium]|nr:hypothetical protein [Betaproteobacteria bacterium]
MNMRKRFIQLLPIAALGLLASADAAAQAISENNCKTSSVTITGITKSDGGDVVWAKPIEATSCFGLVRNNTDGTHQPGNDSGYLSNPDPNKGYAGDGLLNGQEFKHGSNLYDFINPGQFIDVGQMQDLSGNGVADDPGWIYLGKSENGQWLAHDQPFDIGSIVTFKMGPCTVGSAGDCKGGTWTLETSLDIIEKTQAELGRNAFDHLAIILKSSDAFAIYDFDFNYLAEAMLAAGGDFDFETPYTFTGTWSTQDFTNTGNGSVQGISHISVWARDPLPPDTPDNPVPVPGTLALTALGLILLGRGMRTQKV